MKQFSIFIFGVTFLWTITISQAKELDDLIATATHHFGDRVTAVRVPAPKITNGKIIKAKQPTEERRRRVITRMRNKSNPLSQLPPGVLIRPGSSMGLSSVFSNETSVKQADGNQGPKSMSALPFDPKLLGQLKHLLPGSTNVDDIQDELDGMLFGKHLDSPDSSTAASTTTSTTTEKNYNREVKNVDHQHFQPSLPLDLNPSESQRPTQLNQAVINGGDRAFEYDYTDYDLYAYDDEETEKLKREHQLQMELQSILDQMNSMNTTTTTETPLPTAEPQRMVRRPGANGGGLRRRRIQNGGGAGIRKRPYFEDVSSINFGDYSYTDPSSSNNRRVSSIDSDDYFYNGPGIRDIPGRIQDFIPNNARNDFGGTFNGLLKRPTKKKSSDCDYYTDSLCLEVTDYPRNEIVSLLSVNRRIGADLIADVIDQSADNLVDGVTAAQENRYTFTHYYGGRREDEGNHVHRDFAQDGGFLCPSEIKYAKPKRGKTAQGVWKDIVNVNDYTQTLRMEKCMKPGGQCSYVSHHYKSQCSQVYNYHRLLSWDKERGLHMDIYKVPTCCSCHIMGYSYVYPPLSSSAAAKTGAIDLQQPLPTSPPALLSSQSKPKPSKSLLPKLNAPSVKNFLDNIGNTFNFAGRNRNEPEPQPSSEMSSRPSKPVPQRVRKRPNQLRRRAQANLPRRRMDPGMRKNMQNRLKDMTLLGSEAREAFVAAPEDFTDDIAAHRYEEFEFEDDSRIGKSGEGLDKIEGKDLDEGIELPAEEEITKVEKKTDEESSSSTKDQSVNYGYHPIIDFFGNFRFDTA